MSNEITSIKLAEYTPPLKSERENSSREWVNYGDYNDYPNYLLELYQASPTHHALTDKMVQMITGEGIHSALDGGEYAIKQLGINKELPSLVFDHYVQGGCYTEVIRNLKEEELKVNHLPFENCRLGIVEDDDGLEINGIWYSEDWSQYRKKMYEPVFVPLYDPQAKDKRSVIISFKTTPGSKYYPSPSYEGAINYIEAEIQIGIYHNNQLLNGLFPSFAVNFRNGIPTDDERDKVTRDIERKIGGAKNAGKFLVTFNPEGSESAPTFEQFNLSDQHSLYEYLDKACTEKILVGHRMVSRSVAGLETSDGFSNKGEEMKEAKRQTLFDVVRPEREAILSDLKPLLDSKGIIADWSIDDEIKEIDSAYLFDKAQVSTVTDMVEKYNAGTLSPLQARSLVVSMLGFTEDQAEELFPDKATELSKKKAPKLEDAHGEALADALEGFGHTIEDMDADGWELVRVEDIEDGDVEEEISLDDVLSRVNLSEPQSYAHPGERSEWGDSGLYKLRYRYSQNLSENSRPFCTKMVGLSKTGYIFRKEDIDAMSNDTTVNGKFAPEGQSTYDIFTWKGGVYCHHKWERLIFFRKRDENGKFLPPSREGAKTERGMSNDKRVGNVPYVPQKGEEGTAPINTPSRGSLKYS